MSFFPNTSRLRQNIQNLLAQGIDSKLKFSLEPVGSETGVEEWKNAMKAVTRLPGGIPNYFRAKLWITLADEYFSKMCIDWKEVQATCLSEKIQQDDTEIDSQIIKDLHRTGWNGFNEEKKLKQVLLAYARYNKEVGYCQGFNIIAALILQVVDFKTDISLKVMIFVIEQVLPQGYFDHSLRALSVDMAVMKDLILQRLPKTIQHLEMLQSTSGNEYEPPLTNVFSMHWFLTLFATCLPRYCVYRIWDAIMLEGSEILLRTAIALWAKMSRVCDTYRKIIKTKTADEFYTLMEELCKQLTEMNEAEQDNLILVSILQGHTYKYSFKPQYICLLYSHKSFRFFSQCNKRLQFTRKKLEILSTTHYAPGCHLLLWRMYPFFSPIPIVEQLKHPQNMNSGQKLRKTNGSITEL
uniref:Rab-GAP TBC domain-containing protein n=1 Tax=Heterorhabditis bacteriophora TaxID=37862 RepID=A0A1I7XDH4_HETBA